MCLSAGLFGALGQSHNSSPEITQLLNQAMKNQRLINNRLTEYTSTCKQTSRDYNDKGKLKEENIWISESYQSSKRNVEVIISKNGKPLSSGKIEKERAEAVKALTEDEKSRLQTAQQVNREGPEMGFTYSADKNRSIRLSVFDFIRFCDFFSQHQETINGREMIALDFSPQADSKITDPRLAPIAKMSGTLWIDKIDVVPFKLSAFLITDPARQKLAYQFENLRQPDGTWLLAKMYLNTSINPTVFNGLNLEYTLERSGYQRFSAQAEDVKLIAPKKQ